MDQNHRDPVHNTTSTSELSSFSESNSPTYSKIEESRLEESRLEGSRIQQSRIQQSRIQQSRIQQSRIQQSRIQQSRIESPMTSNETGTYSNGNLNQVSNDLTSVNIQDGAASTSDPSSLEKNNSPPTIPSTTPSIGFIIPPQDVQKIIVKTAEWVAKKGESFLEKLKSKQKGQFPFLENDHFYYAFYTRVLEEFEKELREYGTIQSKLGPEFLEKIMASPINLDENITHTNAIPPPNQTTGVIQGIAPGTTQQSTSIVQGTQPLTSVMNQATPTNIVGGSAVIQNGVNIVPPVPSKGILRPEGTRIGAAPTSEPNTFPIPTPTIPSIPTSVVGVPSKLDTGIKPDSIHRTDTIRIEEPTKIESNAVVSSHVRKLPVSKKNRSQPTEDPFPRTFTIDIPKDLNEMQLEIIKTTAMYVAKNGMQFLGAIAGKHANNPIFEFTKLSHQHFTFFSKLCEVYKKLIRPTDKLRTDILFMASEQNKYDVLQRIYEKAEWDLIQKERKRRERERKKEEQEAMLSIDWQDFVIVETIDFDPEETLNLMVETDEGFESTSAEEMALSLQGAIESGMISYDQMNTGQYEQLSLDQERNFVYIGGKRVPIKRDYSRTKDSVENATEVKYVKNEDGTLIPMSELQHHMKVSLINPQWKEQKKKELEKFQFSNLASNTEMAETLSELAKARQSGTSTESEENSLKETREPPRKRVKNE